MTTKTNVFCCGACGETVPNKDGEVINAGGYLEFVHRADKCQIAIEEELNKRLCQLCGEDIGDITKGATVLPWGETCGTCFDLIKVAN